MGAENMNRWVGTGNLTRDVEYKEPREGLQIANMRIAVNSRVKRDGQWTDKANYVDVTCFGALARNCNQYLAKGSGIAVDGRLDWREWEDKEGNKRQALSILADNVQFLTFKDDGNGGGSNGGSSPSDTFAPANTGSGPAADDDIPF